MKTLNIIGGGRVGKTLGLLWRQNGLAEVQQVFCRSTPAAVDAVGTIGAGEPTASWDDLVPAGVHLLSVPDDALPATVQRLAETIDLNGAVVFHTSGWMSSDYLDVARQHGAAVASVHPIKGFAEPVSAAASFDGTPCGIEGDKDAVSVLGDLFSHIGGRLIPVEAKMKPLYHTATIIGCNYVVALTALAQRSLVAAGITPDRAMEMLVPLLRGTVDNLERLGPVQALTGPISRGDASTVEAHMTALNAWDTRFAHTYADLGLHTVDIAAEQGTSDEMLDAMRGVLRDQ
jgi:predicted short-subunit dehydrogenase-like oxidoreductase (DUF2520 family)